MGFRLKDILVFIYFKYTSILTLISNTLLGIAIVLMKFSLPQPEADMSLVSPIVVSVFTPIPLLTAIIIQEIRGR